MQVAKAEILSELPKNSIQEATSFTQSLPLKVMIRPITIYGAFGDDYQRKDRSPYSIAPGMDG